MLTSHLPAYRAFSSSRTDAQPGVEIYSAMARKFPILARTKGITDLEIPQELPDGTLLYDTPKSDSNTVPARLLLSDLLG